MFGYAYSILFSCGLRMTGFETVPDCHQFQCIRNRFDLDRAKRVNLIAIECIILKMVNLSAGLDSLSS